MPELSLPARAAMLLDLDGTLIDFAPTPDSVVVPDDLRASLARLREMCGGALAVVTGRPIEQVDGLLGDLPYAVAGEHGGAIRHAPGAAIERVALADAPAAWLAEAERLAAAWPGALVERKRRSFVLHYRMAPEAGPTLGAAMQAMAAEQPERFAVMPASMAWEMKPLGADKGTAVMALMGRAPFAGRVPVYVGDDVTDEDGMAAARALGGLGWRVQEMFGTPASVRAWLAKVTLPDF